MLVLSGRTRQRWAEATFSMDRLSPTATKPRCGATPLFRHRKVVQRQDDQVHEDDFASGLDLCAHFSGESFHSGQSQAEERLIISDVDTEQVFGYS